MEGGVGEREVDIMGVMLNEKLHGQGENTLFGRRFLSMEEMSLSFGRNLGGLGAVLVPR